MSNNHGITVAGTMGGTLITLFANIHSEDLIKTVVLSSFGALISFGISLGLRWLARWLKTHFRG